MELKTSSSKKLYTPILIFILLSVLIFQAVSSLSIKSPTYDEPYHLTSGYIALTKKDYRYGADHPPLLKSLAALPLLFLDLKIPENYPELIQQSMFTLGSKFLFQPQHDVDQIVFLSRLPLVLLSCLLGFYVFLWAKALYGEKGGLFALILYVVSPNILAYSRFVTTDFGVSCFIFIACFYFWNYLNNPSLQKLCLTSLFLGLALVSKFSAIILIPIFFIIVCVKLLTERESKLKNLLIPQNSDGTQSNLQTFFMHFGVPLIIVLIIIFFAYGLSFNFLTLYNEGVNHLKETYFRNNGPRLYYLLGYFFYEPSKLYPIVTFLVKTPVSTQVFIVISLLVLLNNRKNLFNELCLIIPIVFVFAATFTDVNHTGVRRFLPIYPFIFVFVAKLTNHKFFSDSGPLKKQLAFATMTILTLWYVVSSVRVYPDYLAYFNEAIGGPKNGINYLDNANIDWGQDLKRLKPYMKEAGIDKIKLMYEGTADSKYYGISTIPLSKEDRQLGPQSGYYAISAHYLIRLITIPEAFGFGPGWKKKVYKPIKVIGHTIYIFNFGSS